MIKKIIDVPYTLLYRIAFYVVYIPGRVVTVLVTGFFNGFKAACDDAPHSWMFDED